MQEENLLSRCSTPPCHILNKGPSKNQLPYNWVYSILEYSCWDRRWYPYQDLGLRIPPQSKWILHFLWSSHVPCLGSHLPSANHDKPVPYFPRPLLQPLKRRALRPRQKLLGRRGPSTFPCSDWRPDGWSCGTCLAITNAQLRRDPVLASLNHWIRPRSFLQRALRLTWEREMPICLSHGETGFLLLPAKVFLMNPPSSFSVISFPKSHQRQKLQLPRREGWCLCRWLLSYIVANLQLESKTALFFNMATESYTESPLDFIQAWKQQRLGLPVSPCPSCLKKRVIYLCLRLSTHPPRFPRGCSTLAVISCSRSPGWKPKPGNAKKGLKKIAIPTFCLMLWDGSRQLKGTNLSC